MSHLSNIVAIVDAYSSGAYFADTFRAKGYVCIHIQSQIELINVFKKSFKPESFVENFKYDGDLEKLTLGLKKYHIKCVIAGSEPGVELADIVSEALGLRTNGTSLSKARRNKFEMALALQTAHLPTPKFCKISFWDELTKWIASAQVEYPIVLKPLNSGGTDGVFISQNEKELKFAFESIHGKVNVLGFTNLEILAQSFLKGQEYIVNSVSLEGKTYIAAILKGEKRFIPGHGYIYDREIMKKRHGIVQDKLVEMHEKVIAALQIKNGPAHGEYMYTDEGPILIEVAARIAGGVNPKGNTESVNCNQMELTVDAYVDPESFLRKTQNAYERKKHFYDVEISTPFAGVVGDTKPYLESIERLKSFSSARIKVTPGTLVRKTVDLVSSICNVFLVHPDKEVIKADYKELLRLSESLVQPENNQLEKLA